MKNAVGREIPDYLLTGGREVYQGKNHMDGREFTKAAPTVKRYEAPRETKLASSIREALEQCGFRPKTAIVMLRLGVGAEEAKTLLDQSDGRIAAALERGVEHGAFLS